MKSYKVKILENIQYIKLWVSKQTRSNCWHVHKNISFFSSEDSVDGWAGAPVFCLGDAPSVGCWRTPLESEADTACWHPPLTVGGCYTCQSSGEWAWHSDQLCWSADCGTASVCVVSLGTPYHLNKIKKFSKRRLI